MIKACGKRLIIKEIEEEIEDRKSIVIVPKKREQVRGIIIALGSEVDQALNLGDLVILPDDHGIHITIDGDQFLSISENQILAACQEGDV